MPHAQGSTDRRSPDSGNLRASSLGCTLTLSSPRVFRDESREPSEKLNEILTFRGH